MHRPPAIGKIPNLLLESWGLSSPKPAGWIAQEPGRGYPSAKTISCRIPSRQDYSVLFSLGLQSTECNPSLLVRLDHLLCAKATNLSVRSISKHFTVPILSHVWTSTWALSSQHDRWANYHSCLSITTDFKFSSLIGFLLVWGSCRVLIAFPSSHFCQEPRLGHQLQILRHVQPQDGRP